MAVWISRSEEETLQFAKGVSEMLLPGDVLFLRGDLGSGKTLFTQGIASSLGYTGYVHSPSYALINVYEAETPLFHLDLYRLGEEAYVQDLGLDAYDLHEGVTLIEWPNTELAQILTPRFEIHFEALGERERKISIRENPKV